MSGRALAAAAEALVGARFRLHGRDPEHGLDCIGVLAAALAAIGRPQAFPTGYALRVSRPGAWLPDPAGLGFAPATGELAPGDVVLVRPGPAQVHLGIAVDGGAWVHAHAGLRRVVRSSAMPTGAPIGRWRLTDKDI